MNSRARLLGLILLALAATFLLLPPQLEPRHELRCPEDTAEIQFPARVPDGWTVFARISGSSSWSAISLSCDALSAGPNLTNATPQAVCEEHPEVRECPLTTPMNGVAQCRVLVDCSGGDIETVYIRALSPVAVRARLVDRLTALLIGIVFAILVGIEIDSKRDARKVVAARSRRP